ncbi:uncharacterized protein N7515_007365 [Penicillium bovifimosum]|uniref:Uncharacterized protein n=1 Tax=Penicillium bovifimosum TaxID=126998 RepID=A0A9W9GWP0_9EURO|nr:uncharacterized protein N7515_007365 [Penicillium bovifimosum]KAJ5131326.1 hypothetical protein N7515_007365 [Penicillium bovifimosum]
MTAYIRMLKPLATSRRIWAVLPSPVLTLRLSTLKTFCNCKTYGAPNISIVLQYPVTLKLSVLEITLGLKTFQAMKLSIPQS